MVGFCHRNGTNGLGQRYILTQNCSLSVLNSALEVVGRRQRLPCALEQGWLSHLISHLVP